MLSLAFLGCGSSGVPSDPSLDDGANASFSVACPDKTGCEGRTIKVSFPGLSEFRGKGLYDSRKSAVVHQWVDADTLALVLANSESYHLNDPPIATLN